jgi:Flp pilus assembly protein TadD
VHFNLGLALMSRGRVDEAIAHFERVLELAPDFAQARSALAAARAARAGR